MLPDHIIVGPLTYRIVYVRDLKDDDGKWLHGWVLFTEQEMRIDAAMSEERKRITLLHEALHAIEETRGLKLDEPTVIALGTAIYELLRDNPWLAPRCASILHIP